MPSRPLSVNLRSPTDELPHEADGSTKFLELHEGQEIVDDVSGLFLNKELAIQARKLEIDFFKDRRVYEKVPKEHCRSFQQSGLM